MDRVLAANWPTLKPGGMGRIGCATVDRGEGRS
jgi:hypothetical protein